MKAQESYTADIMLIHIMIHRRPLMHPMFSPFKSTLGQSGQTINAHEFSPGERQKIPLSLQCPENQGNDLLLPKSNDAFFNLHSPCSPLSPGWKASFGLCGNNTSSTFLPLQPQLPPLRQVPTDLMFFPSLCLCSFPQSSHWSAVLCPFSKTTHPWVSLLYHLCVFENQTFLDNSFFIQF